MLPSLEDMTDGLAVRLAEAGLPLWRLRISIRTLHPLIAAISATWERDGGLVATPRAPHGIENRATYIGSPLAQMAETGQPFRRRLSDALSQTDHQVLHELKARGATDYFGAPMPFTQTPGGLCVVVTDAPDGFSTEDIAQIKELITILAPIVEVFRLKLTSQAVTDAYLGPRSAARVLSGQITRGHIETIRAAILFSDIRGWTSINTRLPPSDTVAIANRYFDIMTDAISTYQGEVLKLMGDGILAIFPDDDDRRACASALAAAQAAQQAAEEDPEFSTQFGIGMHVGDVLYGNIGSAERLDFTVLGAAVNFTSRIEALCTRMDRKILFSQDFADQLETPTRHVGTEPIKGLETAQPIYAPA